MAYPRQLADSPGNAILSSNARPRFDGIRGLVIRLRIQANGLILFSACLLGGCAGVLIPPGLDSGISGVVFAGPTCPIQTPDNPECDDQPYAASIVVVTADGRFVVTRFTAGTDGRFRVPLFPGTYLLDPLPGAGGFPDSSPQSVVVHTGAFTDLTISYDTGIR